MSRIFFNQRIWLEISKPALHYSVSFPKRLLMCLLVFVARGSRKFLRYEFIRGLVRIRHWLLIILDCFAILSISALSKGWCEPKSLGKYGKES